jgi:hypothetical protein
MQIDVSDEHASKADSSRVESLEPASNVTRESLQQALKHLAQMVSTDEGMQTERRYRHRLKASTPRIEIWAPASNVKSESPPQWLKQPLQIL